MGEGLETGDAPDLREAHRTNEEVVGVLSPTTERDYRQVVGRWTRDGQPDPATLGQRPLFGGDQAERSCWAHLALQGEPREDAGHPLGTNSQLRSPWGSPVAADWVRLTSPARRERKEAT